MCLHGVPSSAYLYRKVLPELADRGLEANTIVVVAGDRHREARRFVSELRRAGIRVDIDPGDRSVKAQFRMADRRGASGVLIIGDEWEEGRVVAKNLVTGDQQIIAHEEVATWTQRL